MLSSDSTQTPHLNLRNRALGLKGRQMLCRTWAKSLPKGYSPPSLRRRLELYPFFYIILNFIAKILVLMIPLKLVPKFNTGGKRCSNKTPQTCLFFTIFIGPYFFDMLGERSVIECIVMHQFVSTDVRRDRASIGLLLLCIYITIHACLAFSLEDIIRQKQCKRYGFIQKPHIGHFFRLHYFFFLVAILLPSHYLTRNNV